MRCVEKGRRRWRPAVAVLAIVGGAVWAASIVMHVVVPTAPTRAVELGSGGFAFLRSSHPIPARCELSRTPGIMIGGYIAMACGRRSWMRTSAYPLWPVAAIPCGILAWGALADRCRNRAGGCAYCGYDLTGNVSGVCPECGEATGERTDSW